MMRKKGISLLLIVVLIAGIFAGCSKKVATTPQETIDTIEAAGFPMELLPEGVEAKFNAGVMFFSTKDKTFDELQSFYREKLETLGVQGYIDYGNDELLEDKVIDQGYIDLGLKSWLYNGVVGEDHTLYISIEQRVVQINVITTVYVAYDEIEVSHSIDDGHGHTEEELAELNGASTGENEVQEIQLEDSQEIGEVPEQSEEVLSETTESEDKIE